MPKKKTSKKRASSSKSTRTKLKFSRGISEFGASKRIKDKRYVSKALWECLLDNDTEGFKGILRAHLELINKEEFAKETGIPRRTLFRMLTPSGNPTLENISKIVHKLSA